MGKKEGKRKVVCCKTMLLFLLAIVAAIGAYGAACAAENTETYFYGDVNLDGEVTVKDALVVLRDVVELEKIEDTLSRMLADMDGDNAVTSDDALAILRTVVKLEEKKPYEAPTEEPTATPVYFDEIDYYVPEVFSEEEDEVIGFPGADGFGKNATGGKGGTVYEVTTLADSGEGSLREALEASGPRIVVFKVSGTIYLQSRLTIKNGDITIAGQTAPGDGICIANYGLVVSKADNVIIRYIRVRPGDQGLVSGSEEDGVWVQACKNVIIDHCSVSWGVDETLSVSPSGSGETYADVSDKVSVQWCTVTESIMTSRFTGKRHGMGSLIRGAQGACVTFHHNFYATHSSRMPMCGNYMANEEDDGNFNFEFINNVVYNWSSRSSGKCADADSDGIEEYTTNINYINNVFKKGNLSTNPYAFAEGSIGNHMYISGNMMEGVIPEDQRSLVYFEEDVLASDKNPYYKASGKVIDEDTYFLSEPFSFSKMSDIQEAADAETDVLESVGASLNRDSVDTAIIDSYINGTTSNTINSPSESLGWTSGKPSNGVLIKAYFEWIQGKYPELDSYEAYVDSDKDGMSDDWEQFMGLDPNDASDGAETYKDTNYTNLDVFLQFLIENPNAAIDVSQYQREDA